MWYIYIVITRIFGALLIPTTGTRIAQSNQNLSDGQGFHLLGCQADVHHLWYRISPSPYFFATACSEADNTFNLSKRVVNRRPVVSEFLLSL